MAEQLVIAVDQGTSSTKGLLLNERFAELASASRPIGLQTPEPGWVQQDAGEIWRSVVDCLNKLGDAVPTNAELAGIALSNQRESAVAWSAATGEPIGPMLGWQDRRTQAEADSVAAPTAARIRDISGLPLDPMFSALKFAWLLENTPGARAAAERGEVLLGTVDSYIRFRLTGEHVVEAGNASRTQLLDLATGDWSPELLQLFAIPSQALPRVVSSTYLGAAISATELNPVLRGKRVLAVLADSHAALYGQSLNQSDSELCIKATLGTGSSIMAVAPAAALDRASANGLVSTIAWSRCEGDFTVALEGNILSSGSTVVWLAEAFGRSPADLAELAEGAEFKAEQAVNLVPSFGGLGAPWWQSARGATIEGMSLGTGLPQLARAAFESIALQIGDLLDAVDSAVGESTDNRKVFIDGGPAANNWLLQLIADLTGRTVVRSANASLSAVGAAAFGATTNGVWANPQPASTSEFAPKLAADLAKIRIASWHAAVHRALSER